MLGVPIRGRIAVVTVLSLLAGHLWAEEPPQLGIDPLDEVIAAMTVEEKVGLVMGTGMRFPGLPPQLKGPDVERSSEGVLGAAGDTYGIPRLGIPSLVLADGPAGLRIQPRRPEEPDKTYYCTAFPIATLLASSWDAELVAKVGRAMGAELRDYGADILLAPALNIHRNPLGGRNFEYYSEDPLVTGSMAAAMVRGVQSQGVGTSLKHYVANNHEWNRDTIDVQVSEHALREIYLRGFEIAVKQADPWTIMSSYNQVNGRYTSESSRLLTGVLRDEWGFDGLVMTDWFGGRDPVAQIQAGNDLLMPGTQSQREALLAAVESGELAQEILDRSIARILGVVQRSLAFQGHAPSNAPDLEAHAEVARDAALQGMVLLQNRDGSLPLAAGSRVALLGNASYRTIIGGTGSGDVNEAYAISLFQGLTEAGLIVDGRLAELHEAYLQEQEADREPAAPFMPEPPLPEMEIGEQTLERLALETDLAIFTLGRNSGEFRDRMHENDFELSEIEQALIAATAAAFHERGKDLVVILNIGGVIETASWRDQADAILLAWQPGQEAGRAIADVLSGRSAPSGKLATTFPVRWEDVASSSNFPGKTILGPDPDDFRGPLAADRIAEVVYEDDVWVGYRHFASRSVEAAYPFGFGLSYTEFLYGDLQLEGEAAKGGLTASARVTNTGTVAGREVVQLYISAPGKGRPALELRGFAKTRTLRPGESEAVQFALGGRDLASFDEAASAWVAEAGTYEVSLGASSVDLRQKATFELAEARVVESAPTDLGPQPSAADGEAE